MRSRRTQKKKPKEFVSLLNKKKIWYDLGVEKFTAGNFEAAIAAFDEAIKLKPNYYQAWDIRGVTLGHLERYEEALASLDTALELKPNFYEAWSNRGLVLSELERYEEALVSYDIAIELKPNFYEAWSNRGLVLSELERYEEALASLDTALKLKPDFYLMWYNRGLTLDDLGQYEEALTSFDKALKFSPKFYHAWNSRGSTLRNLEQYEEALTSCNTALKFNPDFYQAWNTQGLALLDLGRYEEAIASFNKALKLKPDFYQSWTNRGLALSNLGRYEEALASHDKALKFKPDFYEAWIHRGNELVSLGRYEEALASFDKTLEFKPDFYQAWNLRGNALVSLGRYEEALASFDKTLEFNLDSYEVCNLRGNALVGLGQHEEALVFYDTAIELKFDSYQAWSNRGLALMDLGRYEESLASLDTAIEFKPDYYQAWHNRGNALSKLGQYADAIVSYNTAIRFNPDDHQVWNNKGYALSNLGRHEEAIASFDTAIKFKPDDYQAWNNKGLTLSNLERYEEAIASFDTAIKFKPDFHEAWDNRGRALNNLGQYEEALASLDTVLKIKPDFHVAWDNRGNALNNLGRYEEALASYDTAIEFKPDFHEAWNNRGNALNNLGQYEEALASYNTAIELKSDFYIAWNNRGNALNDLGKYEEALASFDTAIELKSDFYIAWNNRGRTLNSLERYEDALVSFDTAIKFKPDSYQVWIGRGAAAGYLVSRNSFLTPSSKIAKQDIEVNQSGYERALASYEEGLKYCPQDTHAEGWGRLHHATGKVYCLQGRSDSHSRPYWYKAANSYNLALETLTVTDYPEFHLEVLQDLIQVRLNLGETDKAEELQRCGTDVLQNLLDTCKSPGRKQQLTLKFTSFQQLTVDVAVQSGNWCAALELAEKGKNTCLHWLFGLDNPISFPQWRTMQQHLLNPTAAIVYWHLSPAALHTFILKYDAHSPIVITTPVENNQQEHPASLRRLQLFEDWLNDWNQYYIDYRSKVKLEEKSNHPWRVEMPSKLENLKNILNIPAIEQHLNGMTQLILIPHRDLHRFPLHALFSPQFGITYVPSANLGISLRSIERPDNGGNFLLSVEAPNSDGLEEQPFAVFESEAINQLFDHSHCIRGDEATDERIKTALFSEYTIFHFTGHGSYNLHSPKQSALALTGANKLTLEDIYVTGAKLTLKDNRPRNLSCYKLVSLAACETAITGNQTITTEYVGLVSGFLSQGVAQVVSTLWVVESAASALVMIEFYRRWQAGTSAVNALAEATTWLKNLTVQHLMEWYKAILKNKNIDQSKFKSFIKTELRKLNKIEPYQKPYNHPYYWAGFTISGKS